MSGSADPAADVATLTRRARRHVEATRQMLVAWPHGDDLLSQHYKDILDAAAKQLKIHNDLLLELANAFEQQEAHAEEMYQAYLKYRDAVREFLGREGDE